ncbi:MAG: D-alanine--D-alanine ligase [Pseudomonadota bacterium]
MTEKLIYNSFYDRSGVPDLVTGARPTSFYEFWPTWLFYAPMKLYGLGLALRYWGLTLPTITNPLFDKGGFVGESKSQILNQIPDSLSDNVCAHISIQKDTNDQNHIQLVYQRALEEINDKAINFPCVIKPDEGERGMGVQIAYKENDILRYLQEYPSGEKIIVQQMADYPCEAGLFYIRKPNEKKGKIFSLTLKYFPFVVGDGVTTLKDLILKDPRAGKLSHIYLKRHQKNWDMVLPKGKQYRIAFTGSHSRGTIFKNGNPYITKEMEENWDQFCQKIPEFYFGRFDVRFHTMEDLETLHNVKVIEINGASAEATHIWDSHYPILKAYKTLMQQYKYMFEIGAQNRKRGFTPVPFKEVYELIKKNKTLPDIYPHTH